MENTVDYTKTAKMEITKAVMKNGEVHSGLLLNYRPILGYFTLIYNDEANKIMFSDCASVTTGECNELLRAKDYMKLLRHHGWSDFDENFKRIKPPENKFDWE